MRTRFDYRKAAASEFDVAKPDPKDHLGFLDRATWQIARVLCALFAALVIFAFVYSVQALAAPLPNDQLSAIASSYAGYPVVVECETSQQAWLADPRTNDGQLGGYSWPLAGRAVLAPSTCRVLASVLTGGRVQRYAVAGTSTVTYAAAGEGILVFAHEATHLALRSIDEGVTECTAIANVWRLLPALGAHGARRNRLEAAAEQAHAATVSTYRTIC